MGAALHSTGIPTPAISCVVTAYAEGELASVAIDSILSQSFADFELLVVDDGADDKTRDVLRRYADPRIVHIRQANDGLSSARNRALGAVRGDYVCFLDADDSRPPWAFETMIEKARETGADVVFTPGLLSELRNEIHSFYDDGVFLALKGLTRRAVSAGAPEFAEVLPFLAALEPQSANKFVRRSVIEQRKLRFPAGLYFEDMVFHTALILGLGSVAVTEVPCFSYFRRYGRPQITSGRGIQRFDAIASGSNALGLLQNSAHFQNHALRLTTIAAVFKLLKWCEESVAHHIRWQYRQALLAMIADLDPRFKYIANLETLVSVKAAAPWIDEAIDYFLALCGEDSRP